MRKRVIKKLFSLTVASSMILSLTACGNTGNTAAEETQETADAADTEKTEDSEEGITLTAAGYDARYFDEEGNMQLRLRTVPIHIRFCGKNLQRM